MPWAPLYQQVRVWGMCAESLISAYLSPASPVLGGFAGGLADPTRLVAWTANVLKINSPSQKLQPLGWATSQPRSLLYQGARFWGRCAEGLVSAYFSPASPVSGGFEGGTRGPFAPGRVDPICLKLVPRPRNYTLWGGRRLGPGFSKRSAFWGRAANYTR